MISPIYKKTIKEIKRELNQETTFPSISLPNFLEKKEFTKIQKETSKIQLIGTKNILTHSYSKKTFILPEEIVNFIKEITRKTINCTNLLQFKHKDYTLLNDQRRTSSGIDIIFTLNKWSQDYGGQIYYVNGTGEFIQIPDSENTLTIIKRNKETRQFVKYVNNKAKNNKRFFLQIT